MRTSPLVLAALAAGSLLFAQKDDSETPQRLVRLSVIATDAKGDPVTNLQASDLRVREDGKPRTLAFFRYTGARLAAPPAGETINRPPLTPTLVLFDRWNERMMTAAEAWGDIGNTLAHLESIESVYIYFLTNRGELYPVHPLPATDADLRAQTSPTPAQLRGELDDAVKKLAGFRVMDALDPVYRANVTMRALGTLGRQMATIFGRKNLIWVTHGFPLTVQLPGNDWMDFTAQIRQLSTDATQSQITFYVVDESAQGAGADPSGVSRETLQMFASLTGGRWYTSGNTDDAINGAMADSRATYRIAYFSPWRAKDRKEHKIRVEAAQKGIRLLTREGYFGDAPEPNPEELETAVLSNERRSPFDGGEIGLRIETSRTAEGVHLLIHVNPADLLLEKRGANYHASAGIMLAFYQDGFLKTASPAKNVDFDFPQDKLEQAMKDGVTITDDSHLAAQIDQIRVMVFDPVLQALGSATIHVR